ncbi:hypothetical protein DSECCO2_323970 [anaerobic digester metagenome]
MNPTMNPNLVLEPGDKKSLDLVSRYCPHHSREILMKPALLYEDFLAFPENREPGNFRTPCFRYLF